MPDSESRDDIPVTATPAPATAPAPAAVPTAVGAPVPIAPRVPDPAVPPPKVTGAPSRGLMWVAPAVSFAVILGFFAMLGTLLYEEYKPPITIPADKTPAVAEKLPTADKPGTPDKPAADKSAGVDKPPVVDKPAVTEKVPTPTGTNTNPNSLQNVLFTLLGALGAAFTQVVNFWLGSSKGSSDKTDLLAASNPALRR
jgi:hypothetical protein